jgi:alkylation response protein AidB-like acyl-CoA dehydrogenase
MLLWMKSHVDGMRALLFYCGYCLDNSEARADQAEREKWEGLLELLTPICKAYCSEQGFLVAVEGIQVHGGYGYSTEYVLERLYRDAPLLCIGEGTNELQRIIIAKQLIKRNPA